MIVISQIMLLGIIAKILGIFCFGLSIFFISAIGYAIKNKIFALGKIAQATFSATAFFILGLYAFQIIVIV